MKHIRDCYIVDRFVVPIAFSLAFAAMTIGQVTGRPRTAPSPTPSPTPIASQTPTPTPKPVQIETIAELQSKIFQRLSDLDVRRGRIGIKIVSLRSGKVIFENDADKYFMPASNMKNFTMATAMEKLTPDFRFVTSVFAGAVPDAAGTIHGDLRIYGRGDVSISTSFNGGDYYKGLDNLVDRITAAGVKRVEGDLVADESYFTGNPLPDTWEWDDLQWYDGAEISALPINNNSVDLNVKPGSGGGPCIVTVLPENVLMQVLDRCVTTSAGTKPALKVFKPLERNVLEISGTMPAGDKGFTGYIAFTHPADLFVALLKQRLEARGVVVTGASRTLPPNVKADPNQIEIAKLESPPFSLIAAKTLKPSQNMYTETILWTLGEKIGRPSGATGDSAELGLGVVRSFLASIGIPSDGIDQYDGSGLSRHDLITPSAVVSLYTYMANKSQYAQVWRDSLSIGGVDGTLRNRFKGTLAAGNIHGKTGTIDQVSALSGYLTTAGGEQVVLSIVVNGVPGPSTRVSLIDDIVVDMANFNGKIDQ